MPLPYRTVKDLYDTLHDAGVTNEDLPAFAARMNEQSGTNLYDEGLHDNFIKRTSVALDRLLEKTGLPEQTAKLGRAVGDLVGRADAGEEIGRGLPRLAANFAALPIAAAAAPYVGGGALLTGGALGLSALLSGAQTYTETGSPAAGAISGITAAALPGVANVAERAALRGVGAKLVEGPLADAAGKVVGQASEFFPTPLQDLLAKGAGQAAAAATLTGSQLAEQATTGQELNVDPVELGLNMTLGALPFAALHLGSKALGFKAAGPTVDELQHALDASATRIELRTKLQQLEASKSTLETIPVKPQEENANPNDIAEANAILSGLRAQQTVVKADPNLSPEDKAATLKKLSDDEQALPVTPKSPTTVFGDSPDVSDRTQVIGDELQNRDRSRTIFVRDDERNPPELRGRVINYSKGTREPEPTRNPDGSFTFGVAVPQWRTDRGTLDEWKSYYQRDPNQPDLPVQERPITDTQLQASMSELQKASTDVETAETNADLQQAVVRLQAVQDDHGITPTDDSALRTTADALAKSGQISPQDIAKTAVKAEVSKTQKKVEALAQRQQDIQTGNQFRLEQEQSSDKSVQEEVGRLKILEQDLQKKAATAASGNRVTALLGGELNRMYRDWVNGGRVGGMDKFVGDVWNVVRTGQGLLKVNEVEPPVAKLVTRNFASEAALVATHSAEGTAAFNGWDRKNQTTIGLDAHMFQRIFGEFGSFHDIDVDEMAGVLHAEDGIPIPEAKDEITDFLTRPHVQVWGQLAEQKLQSLRVSPLPPRNAFAPPVDPVTLDPQAKSMFDQIGTTGQQALNFVTQSPSQLYSSMAKDLAKFGNSLSRIELQLSKERSIATLDVFGHKVTIFLADHNLVDRAAADYTVLHELIHGLTLAELNEPVNVGIRNALDGMRQELIQRLPNRLQTVFQDLQKANWYERYSNGDVGVQSLRDLGLSNEENQILYGLFSTDEFASMGLSSQTFQSFLRINAATKGGSWYSRFANTIKTLLGFGKDIEGSAFEQFLSLTDRILENNDSVMSFRNFTDRYFGQLGLNDYDTGVQARRALSLVQAKPETADDVVDHMLSYGWGSQVHAALNEVKQALNTDPEVQSAMKLVLDEVGAANTTGGLTSLAAEALRNDSFHDNVVMLPLEAQRFVFSMAQDMKNTLDVIDAGLQLGNKGLLNINPKNVKGLSKAVSESLQNVTALTNLAEDVMKGQDNIRALQAVNPAITVSARLDPKLDDTAKVFTNETIKASEKGLGYALQPVAQLARERPETAELLGKGFLLQPRAREFFANAIRVFGIDLQSGSTKLNDDTVKAATKVVQNPRTLAVINRWMAENQLRAKAEDRADNVTLLPATDPAVAEMLKGLSADDKNAVVEMVTKATVATRAVQQQILDYMTKIASTRAATFAMKDIEGLKSSQAIALTQQMWEAFQQDQTTVEGQQAAETMFNSVRQHMTPEGFLGMLKYMQAEVTKYKLWSDYFEKNSAWATAQRMEKYLVNFDRGGKHYQLQASSTKEGNIIAKGGTKIEITPNPIFSRDEDAFPVLGPQTPELANRLNELLQTQVQVMKNSLTPEQLDQMVRFDPGTQLLREAAAHGQGIPRFNVPPRLLSQGAEELPFLWNHIAWIQRQSHYWTRQLFRAETELHLNDPDIAADPSLQKQLRQYSDNLLSPDPQIVRRVNRFASTWFMGFAPASAIINGLQTLSTLVPELTAITNRAVHSYRTWLSAIGTVVKAGVGKGEWNDPEIDRLMTAAERAGERDTSMWDPEAQAHETVGVNFQQAMMKNKPQNTWQRLDSISGAWSTAAMWMFKSVERFNHDVTLVAAYRTYRDLGFSEQEATDNAFQVNRAVNYSGGKAARPIGLFSGSDSFSRGAAMLATNMQSYNLGVVSQLSRYLKAGYFRPEGLMPSQVHAARTAAIQMLGTQLAAAGLLGLPFVSGMLAVVNAAFPQLEVNKNLREFLAGIFGSDTENGNVLQDIATAGLPSMLGWDMQSRLSWGNITPGVSEYDGFQPELLLGPPVNLVSSFVDGATKLAQGDSVGAERFVPPGLKKLTQLILSGGTIKDYKDRPLFQPTLGERAGIALGFQPKRLSDFNTASRLLDQEQKATSQRESEFNQQNATQVLNGNFGTVRQALLERARQDKTFDPVASGRAIAATAEGLTFPRVLGREGTLRTSDARTRLLSTFNLPSAGPTETQRVQFRQQVEERLGIQPDFGQLQQANLIDQLAQERPELTPLELRHVARTRLRGERQTPTLLPVSQ